MLVNSLGSTESVPYIALYKIRTPPKKTKRPALIWISPLIHEKRLTVKKILIWGQFSVGFFFFLSTQNLYFKCQTSTFMRYFQYQTYIDMDEYVMYVCECGKGLKSNLFTNFSLSYFSRCSMFMFTNMNISK